MEENKDLFENDVTTGSDETAAGLDDALFAEPDLEAAVQADAEAAAEPALEAAEEPSSEASFETAFEAGAEPDPDGNEMAGSDVEAEIAGKTWNGFLDQRLGFFIP